ncbi:hypothetical protein WOLCODRAFT_21013 [Wolfiporia cocos MD-104 SS10]|uniref:SAP domain-containing protein n=1 Tax=Wolfiporia cocos (strain MD-104) TaxID=742152 RepID=A0A2H3JHU2_WOLCO|nr:hypothetical protein WOLCODRAFT_21013 [Wolfiporia cocos MD-104 SS10]
MQAGYIVLKTGSKTLLDRLHVDVLRQLCKEQGLCFAGVKDVLLSRLHELHQTHGWVDLDSRPTQGQAITKCLDPLQEDLLIEALEAIKVHGQSVLNRFPVSILRRTCAEICGGIHDDYISWSKDELLGRLYEYRVQKGIISDGGLLIRRQGATARYEVPTLLEVERGLRVLENGSKTDLSRLTINILAELCAQNLADGTFEQYRSHKKSDLLKKLHHYRDMCGLGDTAKQQAAVLTKMQSLLKISRTNSVVSLSVGSGLHVVSVQGQYIMARELANAEDILEHGGKTKFNKLSTAALLMLCLMRLVMDNVDALQREGALVALHHYVHFLW